MNENDFLSIDGFQKKMASKLAEGIKDKLINIKLSVIMSSSNIFGRGFSNGKIDLIMNEIPDILQSNLSASHKIDDISKIKGFSKSSAELFVSKIPEFILFLRECNLENKMINNKINTENKKQFTDDRNSLYEKSIVMTGFRDKSIEEKIKEIGGKISTTVRKNTYILLTKNKDDTSSKIQKAMEFGIIIMTPDEFSQKYI